MQASYGCSVSCNTIRSRGIHTPGEQAQRPVIASGLVALSLRRGCLSLSTHDLSCLLLCVCHKKVVLALCVCVCVCSASFVPLLLFSSQIISYDVSFCQTPCRGAECPLSLAVVSLCRKRRSPDVGTVVTTYCQPPQYLSLVVALLSQLQGAVAAPLFSSYPRLPPSFSSLSSSNPL